MKYKPKKSMLICAPVSSRSGYGNHARDLIESLMEHGKYDIKIVDVPWGACPRNALNEDNSTHKKMLDCFIQQGSQLPNKPDIYIDIRIPQEFEQHGNFNIGITAGIETDVVSGEWLEGCNKMDLIIVPSEHSKDGFVKSIYDALQQNPSTGEQQKVGELKLEKPIEVLFEGSDTNIYKPIENASLDLVDDIKEDFCYLVVGQWCQGGYGKDRKDIARTIKLFFETFANQDNKPALILKSNGATYSILDKEDCLRKIRNVKSMFPDDFDLPNVYLLHGNLTDDEMNKLYNHPKVKCMVSLTHGEGFGRPLLEASMTGLPIIAPNWSGHIDFLNEEKTMLIAGNLQEVPENLIDKRMIVPGSKWFNANESLVYRTLEYAYQKNEEFAKLSKEQMEHNIEHFSLKKMTEKFDEIMEKYLKEAPKQVGLNLPKLKKVSKSEPPKMKLPKLKKITSEAKV